MEYLRENLSATQPLLKAPGRSVCQFLYPSLSLLSSAVSRGRMGHTKEGSQLDHGGHESLVETSPARRF